MAAITAEDVKFSFDRYRSANQGLIKRQVATIETPDAQHVRFKLNKPWPDFLTFYSSASGAGWVVPKKYVEKVGDAGFQKPRLARCSEGRSPPPSRSYPGPYPSTPLAETPRPSRYRTW